MAKRRANGEGNIRKRKDGRWEGRYTAGRDPDTGKAIYKNVLGRTQAEVKAKLKKAIGEGTALDPTKAGQYTVGQWLDAWLEDYAKLSIRCLQLRDGAADYCHESHQRLCSPKVGKEGNENSSSGLPCDILRGSKAQRRIRVVLHRPVHRTAPR